MKGTGILSLNTGNWEPKNREFGRRVVEDGGTSGGWK